MGNDEGSGKTKGEDGGMGGGGRRGCLEIRESWLEAMRGSRRTRSAIQPAWGDDEGIEGGTAAHGRRLRIEGGRGRDEHRGAHWHGRTWREEDLGRRGVTGGRLRITQHWQDQGEGGVHKEGSRKTGKLVGFVVRMDSPHAILQLQVDLAGPLARRQAEKKASTYPLSPNDPWTSNRISLPAHSRVHRALACKKRSTRGQDETMVQKLQLDSESLQHQSISIPQIQRLHINVHLVRVGVTIIITVGVQPEIVVAVIRVHVRFNITPVLAIFQAHFRQIISPLQ